MAEITLLHVKGKGATQIGYGRFGVKLAAAIEAQGVEVYNHLESPEVQDRVQVAEDQRTGLTNVACWLSTPGHARGWHKDQYAVIGTMWEASRLPEAYREHLHAFDLVVVPSEQNVELFSPHHPNVKLALLGVDPAEWFYTPRQAPTNEFRFLIGGTGPRKGTDLAVAAFRKVFKTWPKDSPVPKLVMKNPKGEDFYGDRIEMVTGYLTDADEQALYASSHCYLQPSRGEGFGLQPLQAMAQGMPTILTDAHGQASFAHLGYGMSTTMSKAAYFIYGEAGEWWEPSLDELCAHMEYVYNNWDAAEAKGAEAAKVVARDFTWARSAEQFIDAIGRDRLELPYQGDGSWFTPEAKLYPMRVVKELKTEMADGTRTWLPGETYHVTADIKRILFEGGALDASCIEVGDEDSGLLPQQIAELGSYSDRQNYCHACDQRLGSGVTKADELFAEMNRASA